MDAVIRGEGINKEKQEKKEQKQKEKKNTIIKQNIQIGEFSSTNANTTTDSVCCSVLKSGAKKGQQCGAKAKHNGLCARHIPAKIEETKTEETKTDI